MTTGEIQILEFARHVLADGGYVRTAEHLARIIAQEKAGKKRVTKTD